MRNRAMALLSVALASATPLQGQGVSDGLWVSAGAGAGWGRVSCDICQTARDVGPSAYVRIGTMLGPGLRVAAEGSAWTHQPADERENLGAVMAVLYVQPADGPLFLKGGLGYVGYRAGDDIGMNSAGLQVGGGFEFQLGGFALNNYVNLIGSSFGNLKNGSDTIANDVSATLLQFGVGFTMR
jgi:hypothetical protein